MKRFLSNLIMSVAAVMLLTLISCDCMDCIYMDQYGNQIYEERLCGKELDAALSDSSYVCR
jgi:hypothetical protein